VAAVLCPLCRKRKARRACPAVGHQICAVCCGTKRLTEIRCPSDCGYLAASREHPPAAVRRQQQHDVALLVDIMRDFTQRQSQLFLLFGTFITRYQPPELHPLIDADLAEAMMALAATFETAVRGVVYEHRAESMSANRLVGALKPLLAEAGQQGGSAFERDAALVLRRIADGVGKARAADPGNPRALLQLLARTLGAGRAAADQSADSAAPRLILP
jgi:hypothetical protein